MIRTAYVSALISAENGELDKERFVDSMKKIDGFSGCEACGSARVTFMYTREVGEYGMIPVEEVFHKLNDIDDNVNVFITHYVVGGCR